MSFIITMLKGIGIICIMTFMCSLVHDILFEHTDIPPLRPETIKCATVSVADVVEYPKGARRVTLLVFGEIRLRHTVDLTISMAPSFLRAKSRIFGPQLSNTQKVPTTKRSFSQTLVVETPVAANRVRLEAFHFRSLWNYWTKPDTTKIFRSDEIELGKLKTGDKLEVKNNMHPDTARLLVASLRTAERRIVELDGQIATVVANVSRLYGNIASIVNSCGTHTTNWRTGLVQGEIAELPTSFSDAMVKKRSLTALLANQLIPKKLNEQSKSIVSPYIEQLREKEKVRDDMGRGTKASTPNINELRCTLISTYFMFSAFKLMLDKNDNPNTRSIYEMLEKKYHEKAEETAKEFDTAPETVIKCLNFEKCFDFSDINLRDVSKVEMFHFIIQALAHCLEKSADADDFVQNFSLMQRMFNLPASSDSLSSQNPWSARNIAEWEF